MSAIGSACPDLADSLARAHLRGAGTASGAGEGWRKAEPCRGGGGVVRAVSERGGLGVPERGLCERGVCERGGRGVSERRAREPERGG